MKKETALRLLIVHAISNCRGAGQGIRAIPDAKERKKVKNAVQVLWADAYGTDDISDAETLFKNLEES